MLLPDATQTSLFAMKAEPASCGISAFALAMLVIFGKLALPQGVIAIFGYPTGYLFDVS
jgi:hypothetical protein